MSSEASIFFTQLKSTMSLPSLASDNHSGAHPQILEFICASPSEDMPGYDQDIVSLAAIETLKEHLGDFQFCFVLNGTAANTLALSLQLESFESVLATSCSHLYLDSCGSLEKQNGSKVIPTSHLEGKMQFEQLESYFSRNGDQHCTQVKAISLTQPTELGTLYSLEELKRFKDFCKLRNLVLHLDGTRLVYAAQALKCELKEIVDAFDSLSFGGSKCGFAFGEVMGVRNPKKPLKYVRKQSLQLVSKSRYVAAQILGFFHQNLFKTISSRALLQADKLKSELEARKIDLIYHSASNAIFVRLPKPSIKVLRKKVFFYVWENTSDSPEPVVRLMTSWNTSDETIDLFLKTLDETISTTELVN